MNEIHEREIFRRYVAVQFSGLYNMITEADSAWEMAEINQNEYFYVQDHYKELCDKFPDTYEEARKVGEKFSKVLYGGE